MNKKQLGEMLRLLFLLRQEESDRVRDILIGFMVREDDYYLPTEIVDFLKEAYKAITNKDIDEGAGGLK